MSEFGCLLSRTDPGRRCFLLCASASAFTGLTLKNQDSVIRFNRQILVLPLVACLLLVPALAAPASIAHEGQHAHHKAATHSSILCSWLCGVGQGFDLTDSVFVPTIAFFSTLDTESDEQTDDAAAVLSLSRGPPTSSLYR
jgi:hypothetical protein